MKKNITRYDLAKELRKNATQAEKILWEELRKRKCHNLKFRRQHPLKEYIVDFFNYELNLVVEVDGGYHNHPEQQEKDELRDLKLKSLGFTVLRVTNDEVVYSVTSVLEKIGALKEDILASKNHHTTVLSSRRGRTDAESAVKEAPFPSKEKAGMKMTILSTKILTESQRELVLNTGIGLVEYDTIKVEFIDFQAPKSIENAIFTSQNAVLGIKNEELRIKNCFCVGQKTKTALEELGYTVIEVEENASALGKRIVEKHSYKEFIFFCGNKRRDELPKILRDNYTKAEEVEVYKTTLNTKQFNRQFDAVMCFSPSGVQSYFESNEIPAFAGMTICIGETTATEARKYTSNVVIANSTSVESVIAKTVKELNKK